MTKKIYRGEPGGAMKVLRLGLRPNSRRLASRDHYDTGELPRNSPTRNGEGYIVILVYPWDGCSYDAKPCDLCNPVSDPINLVD
jgi:hypothetical protein